jgi:SAM-dependent methyltransferase
MTTIPQLYSNLATWWPLLSPPEGYEEEAALYRQIFDTHSPEPVRTLLELGSGGGSNAYHLKRHYQMTLVDLSPDMLTMSRAINPELEHRQGDMRSVRLNRTFDAVFIHDAIDYMTTLADLQQAVETAYVHCKPNGMALFVPDFMRETFTPYTSHDGNDDGPRGLRYLEWVWDPDPNDTTYCMDFAFLLREADNTMRCEHDHHICGLFSRDEWERILQSVGFNVQVVSSSVASLSGSPQPLIIGLKHP